MPDAHRPPSRPSSPPLLPGDLQHVLRVGLHDLRRRSVQFVRRCPVQLVWRRRSGTGRRRCSRPRPGSCSRTGTRRCGSAAAGSRSLRAPNSCRLGRVVRSHDRRPTPRRAIENKRPVSLEEAGRFAFPGRLSSTSQPRPVARPRPNRDCFGRWSSSFSSSARNHRQQLRQWLL